MDMDQIALLHAAEVCDIKTMRKLLDRGVPIDSRDCYQNTLLHLVLEKESRKAVKFLINNGCDLDATNCMGQTALMVALKRKVVDLAILLIHYGADVTCCDIYGWNALHIVSFYFDDELPESNGSIRLLGLPFIVRLVVSKVSDIDAITTGSYVGHTALSLAAFRGNKVIVDILLQSGANIRIGGCIDSRSVFRSAVRQGWTDIVEERIILFINNGSCLEHFEYTEIHKNPLCRELILRNTELCVRIALNEYNNLCLPKVYQLYSSVIKLPLIDSLKIKNNQNVISEIETSVKCEIQRKTFCNVMDLRPLVLQMMAVRSLIANRF